MVIRFAVGWAFMNVLVKIHPTRFAFTMSLVVIIAWILYYFVDVKLTNYDTKPVKEQLGQIVEVMKRHMILFPGILLQGASISALLPILPTYATKVVGVTTIEYTVAIAIGGIGCAISMLFLSKIIDKNSTGFMYAVIFVGFILFTLFIFGLSLVNNIIVVWIVAAFIGLMYGILLPAWNTFMAGHIDPSEQEETWGVFNSVQGFGSMIGPLFGGLIAQFSNGLNNTFYVSAFIFLLLAIFLWHLFYQK